MKILVIEDDAETAAFICNGLKEQGHVIDLAAAGRDGLFMGASEPELDGLQIVRTLPSRAGGGIL